MEGDVPDSTGLRLDKWLWFARFCKTRTMATSLCRTGKLRLNKVRVEKPHTRLRPGDVLTFPLGRQIKVVRVLALTTRRGPAREARGLYKDLSPPAPEDPGQPRRTGVGRPTKRERRVLDRWRESESE